MAGEVRSQLTITLQGGASGGSLGGSAPAPVSRRANLISPGQALTDYASQRDMRFSQIAAKEIARDREAVLEIEEAIMRQQAVTQLEVSSARRAREAFQNRIRTTRTGAFLEDAGGDGRVGRRAIRSAGAASRRILRGWGTGVVAGLSSNLLVAGDSEAMGAVGRIGLSVVSGGAFGGAPGAVGALLMSTISELMRALNSQNEDIESLKRELATRYKELQREIEESHNELREFREEQAKEFKADLNRIVNGLTIDGYREDRFQRSGLVN